MFHQRTVFSAVLIIALVVSGFCLLLLTRDTGITADQHNKLNVVCTTSIIADAVKVIGGHHIQLTCLMGPGVDPHIYHARERDGHALASADIIFYNGLHLEGKMAELLHNMQQYTQAIACADAIAPTKLLSLPDNPGLYDPHIWFDVPLWIQVVNHIRDTLVTSDQHHAHIYKRNAQRYLRDLEALHKQLERLVATIPTKERILVTAHDAFGYFGRAYGFQVVGLQGISTDSQASTRDIQKLVDFIIEHKIPAIFVESSLPHRTIQAVQEAVQARGWHITIDPELFSDALGTPGSDAGTYIGMIRHNVEAIIRGLKR